MFCPNCGSKLKTGVRFCTECGIELAKHINPERASEPGGGKIEAPASGDSRRSSFASSDPQGHLNGLDDCPSADESCGQDDEVGSGGAKKAGLTALLASTVHIAGAAVPAFALIAAGAAATGAIVFALTTIASPTQPVTEQTVQGEPARDDNSQRARESYEAVLDEFRSFLQGPYDNSNRPHMRDLEMWSDPSFWETAHYTFTDINGDGLDELVIGFEMECDPASLLCAAYTYADGDAHLLFNSGFQRKMSLSKDTVLLKDDLAHRVASYRISSNGELEEVESMAIDYDRTAKRATGTHTVDGSVVEKTEDSWESNASKTPNADKIVDEMMAKYPARTDLSWTPVRQ